MKLLLLFLPFFFEYPLPAKCMCPGSTYLAQKYLLEKVKKITDDLQAAIDQCVGTEQPSRRFRMDISTAISIGTTLATTGAKMLSVAKKSSDFGDFVRRMMDSGEIAQAELIKRFDEIDKTLVNIMKSVQDIPERIRVQSRMSKYQKDRDYINAIKGAYHTYIQNINKDAESKDYAYKHLLKTCDSHDLKNWFDILNADFREDFAGSGNLAKIILEYSGNDRRTFTDIANWIKKDICAAQFLLVACGNARNISWTVHENNHQGAVTLAFENYKESFITGDKTFVQNVGKDIEAHVKANQLGGYDKEIYDSLKKKFYWMKFAVAGHTTYKTSVAAVDMGPCARKIQTTGSWVTLVYFWSDSDDESKLAAQADKIYNLLTPIANGQTPAASCVDHWNKWKEAASGTGLTPAILQNANTNRLSEIRFDSTDYTKESGDLVPNRQHGYYMINHMGLVCNRFSDIFGLPRELTRVIFMAPPCGAKWNVYPE